MRHVCTCHPVLARVCAQVTYIDKKLEKGATWEMTFGQPLTKKRGAKVRVQWTCNRRVTDV